MSMLALLVPLMLSLALRDIDDSARWRCRALELPDALIVPTTTELDAVPVAHGVARAATAIVATAHAPATLVAAIRQSAAAGVPPSSRRTARRRDASH
jgi:hypothetical protein